MEQQKSISYFQLLMRELKSLLKARNKKRTTNPHKFWDPDSEHSKYYKNIAIHFTINEKNKLNERKINGINKTLETDQELNSIRNKVGENEWRKITKQFFELYADFVTYNTNLSDLENTLQKQINDCRKLSESISDNNFMKYTDLNTSPFHGLMAKHVINEPIIKAISLLPDSQSTIEVDDIAMNIFYNTVHCNSLFDLSNVISEYADILEETFTPKFTKKLKDTNRYTKKIFRDYVKISVFNILYTAWPNDTCPDSETRFISNLILGLKGKDMIKNVDIRKLRGKMSKQEKVIQMHLKGT